MTAGPRTQHARVAGALYLVTFAASIPALLLLGPVLDDPEYVFGVGPDTRVLWGCFLDVVNALAWIGPRSRCSRSVGGTTSRWRLAT